MSICIFYFVKIKTYYKIILKIYLFYIFIFIFLTKHVSGFFILKY